MAHANPAPTGAIRPLSPFIVRIRTAGGTLRFTALAHSSGEALGNALALPDVDAPFCASVKPASLRHRA